MMTGPNIPAMREMVDALSIPVIASGGVSKKEDIRSLMNIEGLWGIITGKALYEGTVDLRTAIKLVKGNKGVGG
jgi:phosphoribosylformimino-5-aminoimidazole carboxamide ribotide isomerase